MFFNQTKRIKSFKSCDLRVHSVEFVDFKHIEMVVKGEPYLERMKLGQHLVHWPWG